MFFGGPTIGVNGFSMVFKILRAMVNDGFEVNDGLDVPLNLKSIYNKIQILSRKSIVHMIWTIPDVGGFQLSFPLQLGRCNGEKPRTNRLKVKILSDFGSLHKHFPHGKHRSESEIIDHYFRSQNVKQKSDLNE